MKAKRGSTIRLLLVDDHPFVRAGLHTIHDVATHMVIVGEAATSGEATELVAQIRPDVVLVDLRLPDGSGIELCRWIKAAQPETCVLFLTSYVNNDLVLKAMEAGGDGYLLKESDAHRVVDAIETVLKGGSVFDPAVTRRPDESRRCAGLANLTVQERRVLAEVAKGKTDKEVGEALRLSAKTVRNYLDRVFGKLDVNTRTQAAMLYARTSEGE